MLSQGGKEDFDTSKIQFFLLPAYCLILMLSKIQFSFRSGVGFV